MNKYELPYKIWYVVVTYNDGTTDLIYNIENFTSYKKALINYNSKSNKARGRYLVELIFELETNDDKRELAYSKVLNNNMGYKYV